MVSSRDRVAGSYDIGQLNCPVYYVFFHIVIHKAFLVVNIEAVFTAFFASTYLLYAEYNLFCSRTFFIPVISVKC